MKITFKRDNPRAKKTEHLKRTIFIIYLLRTVTVEPATFNKIDTGIVLILPQKAKTFVTSKSRGDKIFEITGEQNVCGSKY